MSYVFNSTTDRLTAGTAAMPLPSGSVALWFKPTWVDTDGVAHCFFSQFNLADQLFHMEKFSGGVSNTLVAGWFVTSDFRAAALVDTEYNIVANVWQHFACTYNDTTNTTISYINGLQVAIRTASLTTASLTGIRTFGNRTATFGDQDFAGKIGHGAIYGRDLSPSEAMALGTGLTPLAISGLTDYWTMGTGPAPTIGAVTLTEVSVTVDATDNPPIQSARRRGRGSVSARPRLARLRP